MQRRQLDREGSGESGEQEHDKVLKKLKQAQEDSKETHAGQSWPE